MQLFLKLYLIALPVLFGMDIIWLSLISRKFYVSQIGGLMKPVNWPAGILFYLLFIGGLIFFAVIPSIEKNSLLQVAIYGALFGFFCYATYDLTNLATLKNWPLALTIVDIVWGVVLSCLTSSVVFLIASKIK